MPGCPLSPRRFLIFPCQAAEIAVEPIAGILGPDGGPTEASLAAGFSAAAVGSVDGLYFNQDRVAIIRGQMADPRSLDQVVMSAQAARLLGLRVRANSRCLRLPTACESSSRSSAATWRFVRV